MKRLIPTRRVCALGASACAIILGAFLVLTGVALIYPPASITLAGTALLAAAWFINVE